MAFELSLHPYQKHCINYMVEKPKNMVALDAGGGKSLISLLYLQYLRNRGTMGRALITAPNMVARIQWPTEICLWKDRRVIDLNVADLTGDRKQRLFKLRHMPDICLINHEKLKWLGGFADKHPKILSGFDTVIIDESSAFKSGLKCDKFKAMNKLIKNSHRVVELTATPLPYNLEDLFNQMLLIDFEEFGRSVTNFRDSHAIKEGPWKISYSDEFSDRFHSKAAKQVFRVNLEGKIKKPELEYKNVRVKLKAQPVWNNVYKAISDWSNRNQTMAQVFEADANMVYDEVTGKLNLAGIPDREVDQSLLTPAGRYNLIRQLESGFVYVQQLLELTEKDKEELEQEDIERIEANNKLKTEINLMLSNFRKVETDHPYYFINSKKLTAIKWLVNQIMERGEQVLICFWFKAELDMLKRMFPKASMIVAGQNTNKRLKLITKWNRAEIPILLGNPASMGRGLNLQGTAENILFTTLPTSYDLYHQAVTRVWRQFAGADKITCYSMLSAEGFSMQVKDRLEEREINQQRFLKRCEEMTQQWIDSKDE